MWHMLVVMDSHQNQTIIPEEDINIMCSSMSTTIQEQMTWGTYVTHVRQRVHADDRSTFDPSVRQRVHTYEISTHDAFFRQWVHTEDSSTYVTSVRQRVHGDEMFDSKKSPFKINVKEKWRGNQEWTIQRNWQHCVHKNGQSRETVNIVYTRMDNPEKLATLCTQEWTIQRNLQHGVHKNGQSRETGNIVYTRMDNPEKLATLCTQDTERKQAKQNNTTQQTE